MTLAEKILEQIYMEYGSPCAFEADRTAWKPVALTAMREIAEKAWKKSKDCSESFDEWYNKQIEP